MKLLPCVYLSAKQDPTSKQNLSAAMKAGAQCHGLWVANYGNQQPKLRPWNRYQIAPANPVPCNPHSAPPSVTIGNFGFLNTFNDNFDTKSSKS
ncbi:MAG: hypothetical protein HEQ33_03640 [Dolichospermum sp. WA123]|nr:hypothetical protein [Dolichospermum sp. WA123]